MLSNENTANKERPFYKLVRSSLSPAVTATTMVSKIRKYIGWDLNVVVQDHHDTVAELGIIWINPG